jgi:hypothetical protein
LSLRLLDLMDQLDQALLKQHLLDQQGQQGQ